MPTIFINEKKIEAPVGMNLLEVALRNKIWIPHFCYHPALSVAGNCRMCLVEIEKFPKLQTSCTTLPSEGMIVRTDSEKVKKAREAVMEYLLINHPLDCPVCDKAGECVLQDYSFKIGKSFSRFDEEKFKKSKRELGKEIILYSQRCILCSRCIRFLDEISGTSELTFINRGGQTEVSTFPGRPINNHLSGNLVDICPVGALMSKDFLFKARVWFTKRTKSICPMCSKGCNVYIDSLGNKVVRIIPRFNPSVNNYWMCDIGRWGYKYVNSERRAKGCFLRKDGQKYMVAIKEGLQEVVRKLRETLERFGVGAVAGLCSSFCTNEEGYLFRRIFRDSLGIKDIALVYMPIKEEIKYKKFTIEAERSPNKKGLSYVWQLKDAKVQLETIISKIEKGEKKFVYFVSNNPYCEYDERILDALEKVEFVVVHEMCESALTEKAQVVIPGSAFCEKKGSYMNSQNVIQRFDSAVSSPAGVVDFDILKELSKILGCDIEFEDSDSITECVISKLEVKV